MAKTLAALLFVLLVSFKSTQAISSELILEITGNVFLDSNENGIKDANELEGIENVVVNLYDGNETMISSVTTDIDGNYSFGNISQIEICRIVFDLSNEQEELYSASHHGLNNGTFVQFVQVGNVANLALKNKNNDCVEDVPNDVVNVVPWGPTTKRTLLDHGVGAVTCSAYPLDPVDHRYVMGLLNLPEVSTTVDPPGIQSVEPSYPGMFHHPDWVANRMGNVFGIELDEEFNMYVTASSQIWQRAVNAGGTMLTQSQILDVWRYGSIGGGENDLAAAGTIYKIDAFTGEASVFAVLPQQNTTLQYFGDAGLWSRTAGPGLGNISYDYKNQTFYVTNFEDGKIYRISIEGEVLDAYDPLMSDDSLPGFPVMGERIWGIDIYDNKLYFSVWHSTTLNNPYNGYPEVYSIELNEDGSFIGNEQLEFTFSVPNYPNIYSPISDIDFNENGRMLVAQRTMLNNVTVYNHQSAAGIFDYNESTGKWENTGKLRVGHSGPSECYGGGAWDPSRDMIWLSSADINAGWGPHGLMGVNINQFGPGFNQATEWAVVPYTPPGFTEDVKGFGGDIVLANLNRYHNCEKPQVEVGNYIWEDLNGDGIQGASEQPIKGLKVQLYNSEQELIAQAITDEGGHYYFNENNVDVFGINVSNIGNVFPNSGAFTGLLENETYYIVVGKGQTENDLLTLNGKIYELTAANTGNLEMIDSDGLKDINFFNGLPYHQFSVGSVNDNVHNYDFGWKLIEPLEFDAVGMDNSYSQLEWETIQEVNSDYFEVQWSLDGQSWETLEEVTAAGYYIGEQNYSLNHTDPYMGKNYYQLKWVDYDGSIVYSEVKMVEFTKIVEPEEPLASDQVTFPNPISGNLPLHFNVNDFNEANIDIYCVNGDLMWKGKTFNQNTDVNVSHFASGTYILIMNINNTQETLVEKFIIRN
ncbi:MAG: SdrD B-like domain-containing protein [Chitinophagales bacterium]